MTSQGHSKDAKNYPLLSYIPGLLKEQQIFQHSSFKAFYWIPLVPALLIFPPPKLSVNSAVPSLFGCFALCTNQSHAALLLIRWGRRGRGVGKM